MEAVSICPLKFECPDEIECGYAETISILRNMAANHPFNQTLTTLRELVDHCDPPDQHDIQNTNTNLVNVTITKPNALKTQ